MPVQGLAAVAAVMALRLDEKSHEQIQLTDRLFFIYVKNSPSHIHTFNICPQSRQLMAEFWVWSQSSLGEPPPPPARQSLAQFGEMNQLRQKCIKKRAMGSLVKSDPSFVSQCDSESSQVLWNLYALIIRLQRSLKLSRDARGRCRGIMKLWRLLRGQTKQNGCGRSQRFSNKLRLEQMNSERYRKAVYWTHNFFMVQIHLGACNESSNTERIMMSLAAMGCTVIPSSAFLSFNAPNLRIPRFSCSKTLE